MRALGARFWSSNWLTLLRKASSRARRLEGGSGWLRNWVAARLVTRKVASETLARTVIRGVTVPCSVMGARTPSQPNGRHETVRRNHASEVKSRAHEGAHLGNPPRGQTLHGCPAPSPPLCRAAPTGPGQRARYCG